MRIIVTTDGSERSLQALPHAARFAGAIGGELVLGHVVDPLLDLGGEMATSVEVAAGNVVERWRRELAVLLEREGLTAEVAVTIKRAHEPLPEAVLRLARESDTDVIAMATRGTGALRHAVVGSTAMAVISAGEMPVLAAGDSVTAPSAPSDRYCVLATSDGSEASEPALVALQTALPPGSVPVTLLRVCECRPGADEAEAACRAELETARAILPADLEVVEVLRPQAPGGDVAAAILAAAEEFGADAIAMATHGHSARRHLFAGSVALSVLARSRRPVLLVRSRV
jgi:nucleotide-binding universal stress UspA family protein